jgi:polyvinyl alcohol dehydrogenase (cytochrome)
MIATVHARSSAAAAVIATVIFAWVRLAAAEDAPPQLPPPQSPPPPAAPAAPPAPVAPAADSRADSAGVAAGAPIHCAEPPAPVALGSAQWNGWGRGIENTRYQPEPAIRATDVSRLALKWAFGYPGASTVSGQPTIVDGRVFAASAGQVYALDAKSGCTYWRYDSDAHAFSAIAIAELGALRPVAKPKKARRGRIDAHLDVLKPPSAAFVGDDKGAVSALDAERGTLLWKTQIETDPTARIFGAPSVYQNRLYVAVGSSVSLTARNAGDACCTFRGSVAALDIATGRVAWKTYLSTEEPRPTTGPGGVQRFGPAGFSVAAAPTIDVARNLLYVATGDSFNPALQPPADGVVALDLSSGQVRWSKQLSPTGAEGAQVGPAREFTASPILRPLTGDRQVLLVGQRSGVVYGLDPERSGEVLWQLSGAENKTSGGIESGMGADHHSVYVAVSGLSAEPANPSGSLVAIDMKTGVRRWQIAAPAVACSWSNVSTCSHGQAQAVTVIPGAVFSGSMDGHLRAYSTIDGKILWDYDTAKDFATVNRVKAGGGSLDQGGATIVNGVVFVNSGSERGSPGNVLLAFSVDGK